jgi:hypothetical protein
MSVTTSVNVAGKFHGDTDWPARFEFSRHHVTITVGEGENVMETTITRREWDLAVQAGLLWIPKPREEE